MRLLVVKLSSLGDLFHALPAVGALRRQLAAEIDWAVQPEYAGLVHCFEDVARVLPMPRRGGLRARWAAVRALRAQPYDLAIDLQGLLKSALVVRLARAPRRIGPSFHREGARWFYTDVAGPRNRRRHAVDECLDILSFLGLERMERSHFAVRFPDPGIAPRDAGRPRIALAPCSRWPTKNWPVERYAELAGRLTGELGAEVFLIGAAADLPVAARLAERAGTPLRNHCGRHDLPGTGGLLARMDLLVCNDSGPMHIAAALGVPCVALFGPTWPERTGPYGPRHRVLRLGNCTPCQARTCRTADVRCLAQLPVERVMQAVREILG